MKIAEKVFLVSIISIVLAVPSCRLKVPIKEMVDARYALRRAYEVKADKYDRETIDQAVRHLFKSHKSLNQNDEGKSKKEAMESLKLARKAIETSLPLLAKDTLYEAMAVYQEAENLYAEKFAADKLSEADSSIKEADNYNTEKEFWKSYQLSMKAIEEAAAAKEIAEKNIPLLKEDIENLNNEIGALSSGNISQNQKSELSRSKSMLEIAGNKLDEKKIEEAYIAIEEVKDTVRSIKIALKKAGLKERIAVVRKEAELLKEKRGVDFAGEDIEIVMASLNEAESALEQEKVETAEERVDVAEKYLNEARNRTMKGIAREKIESVEKQLSRVLEMDKNRAFADETERASLKLDESREKYGDAEYDKSIQSAGEAESILNSLSVTREKDYIANKEIPGLLEEEKTGARMYIVQYNRKNRDCLWKIAQKIYKNARMWPHIYMANKEQINDPDLIFPGQRFKIPDIEDTTEKNSKKPEDNI